MRFPSVRRAIKWAGITSGMLIVLATAFSFAGWKLDCRVRGWHCRWIDGALTIEYRKRQWAFTNIDVYRFEDANTYRIVQDLPRHNAINREVYIPAWIILLPPIAVVIGTRFLRRPVRPGHCACGYSLEGNTSGVCPECGVEIGTPQDSNSKSHASPSVKPEVVSLTTFP